MRETSEPDGRLAARVLAAIAESRPAMIRLTRDLVEIPTENPPGRHLPACARRLTAELRRLGMDPRSVSAPGAPTPRPCVLAGWGGGKRTLYFHGHYDVVPASRPGQFRAIHREDRIQGRGAADMKSGLAAMIYAVHALERAGVELDGRIGLVLVPDEETGGMHGSRHLMALGILGRNGIGMLTAEPTSGVVWNACRGALTLRLTTAGRHAHVGLQHQGVNAFERMLPIARSLQNLKRRVERRVTRHHLRPEAARHSILLLGGRVEAGTNFNAVPATCSLTVDRRINPEERLEIERRRLMDCIRGARPSGSRLKVEILQQEGPAAASEDHRVARALAASVREVTGRAPRFELCPGLLEIRFYARRSVPAFAYGPGRLDLSHGPAESVAVADIERCAATYALTALRVLGRATRGRSRSGRRSG